MWADYIPGPGPLKLRRADSEREIETVSHWITESAALDIMTRCDYLMVMKRVKIAALKARLSEHLRQVRRGETYTVMDRETPIARLLPYGAEVEPLRVRKPLRRVPSLQDVRLPPPLKLDVDPVALLLEERQVER